MSHKLEDMSLDRDILALRLSEDDHISDQRTTDKVVLEREKLRNLERKMESLMARTSEDSVKYRELEIEKNNLSNEVKTLRFFKC